MRELFRPYVLLLALPALLLAGCDMETPSDQPPPTTADVVINEFMASNASQGADENGEFDDWIELYNRGDAAIDLAGYTVTDNLGDPAKFTIESGHGAATTIQPGGFLMLWCDSTPDQGPLHTSFNLGAGGEDIGIYEASGEAVAELTFPAQTSDVSYGRTVDGGDTWASFSAPTPGAANSGGGVNVNPVIGTPSLAPAAPAAGEAVTVSASVTDDETVSAVTLHYAVDGGAFTQVNLAAAGSIWSGAIPSQSGGAVVTYYLRAVDNDAHVVLLPANAPTSTLTYTVAGGGAVPELFINEILASNSGATPDPFGDPEDWIEIYNAGATAVDLGGMYITDDLATPTKYLIPTTDPSATTVPAGGYLLLWADNEPGEGATHIVPKLSASGEAVGLYTSTLDEIDSVTFGAQTADISFGRQPDGSENWTTFVAPTPGATNGAAGK
jgi:hypothetical protein